MVSKKWIPSLLQKNLAPLAIGVPKNKKNYFENCIVFSKKQ